MLCKPVLGYIILELSSYFAFFSSKYKKILIPGVSKIKKQFSHNLYCIVTA